MAEVVYILCALLSLACAALLFRAYAQGAPRLLMLSALCFVGLTLNNVLLFVDLVLTPGVDLSLIRNLTALGALLFLVGGLIWEAK